MSQWKIIAGFYLVFVVSFSMGILVYDGKLWPYEILREIKHYIKGHTLENTSLLQKGINDLGGKPHRFFKNSTHSKELKQQDFKKLVGLPLKPRREPPEVFLSSNATKGYRLILGTFDFKNSLHGVILLDPEGQVKKTWSISQQQVDWEHGPDATVFPHGFAIFPNGSFIVAFDNGTSLVKYDYCGKEIWRIPGHFHHAVTPEENNEYIWTWGYPLEETHSRREGNINRIDVKTGNIVQKFHLYEIQIANPEISIFDISNGTNKYKDFWHPNDVDPLPKKWTQQYPQFEEGDLLISLAYSYLIFVVDPKNLAVKWWRQGLTRLQHDPDWNSKGTISIFNNSLLDGVSGIIELDPKDMVSSVKIDGRAYNFFTESHGKHQTLPENKGYLITSSNQGRAFEVNENNQLVFEFLNQYNYAEGLSSAISEALFLPLNYFKELPQCP